jgi:hypothetical protein
MNLDERGFVGIISVLFALAIIWFLMMFLQKSFFSPRCIPVADQNGTVITPAVVVDNPQGIMQRAQEQVSQVNKITTDRVNSLLNITDQK